MKARLPELAHVAEIVSAVAIVISLLYLGIQVNGSTRAVRSAATNDAATAVQSWYMAIGSSEQTSRLWFHGVTDPDSLSREELFQFVMMTHAVMLGFQNSFNLAEQGALDVEIRESINKTVVSVKDQPGFELYWRLRGPLFGQDFRDYIDELLRGAPVESAELYDLSDARSQP